MWDILKIILEKVTQFFWQAIFVTALTLAIMAHFKTNIFNYGLFETPSGIAQAIIIFIVALSAYQLLLTFISNIIVFLKNRLYEVNKFEKEQNEIYQQMIQFLEDLFNNQRPNPHMGNVDINLLKRYLIEVYKAKIEKFKANEIADIFQKDADERQKKETRKNVSCVPIVSKEECIKIQNLLQAYNFLYFNGELYSVNKMIFEKFKELENRGMLSLPASSISYMPTLFGG